VIRPATVEDVPAVAALEASVFGVDAWSEAQVEEELTGPRRRAWVHDGLGYVILLVGQDVVDLQRIAVTPAARRQGIARALLDIALASVPGRMLLEVSAANSTAIAFYASAGFVEVDRRQRYYRDGTDAVVMERKP
jgi:ribosomal-protein-alanine N-acetyltransferase